MYTGHQQLSVPYMSLMSLHCIAFMVWMHRATRCWISSMSHFECLGVTITAHTGSICRQMNAVGGCISQFLLLLLVSSSLSHQLHVTCSPALWCSTVQYKQNIKYSIVQYAQCGTLQNIKRSAVQYSTVRTVQYSAMQNIGYNVVQHSTVQCCH